MWCALVFPALSQPAQISLQGLLTDTGGSPLAGPVQLTFRLYSVAVGGTQFFAETHPSVSLVNGVYSVSLGSVSNLSNKDFSRDVYLGVQVDGGAELQPRTLLTGTAAAMTLVVPAKIQGVETVNGALTVVNQATTGQNYGVLSMSDAESGRGVYGYGTHQTGANYGIYGLSRSTQGIGVFGRASATTGNTVGVGGLSVSSSGIGGVFEGPTGVKGIGNEYGVWGETAQSTGFGVRGLASSTSGSNTGVWGRSNSSNGQGVFGEAASASGASTGVTGTSASTSGTGVKGIASAGSGATKGVEGRVNSSSGYGGYFSNTAAGGYGLYASSGPATASPANADILLDGSTGSNNHGVIESTGLLQLKSQSGGGADIGSYTTLYATGTHPDGDILRIHYSAPKFRLYSTGALWIAGALTQNSDRNVKQEIVPVDAQDVLARVIDLPVSTWRYKDDPTVVHMGPMAQDFFSSFGLGAGETGISTLDTSGAALAAIQGLYREIQQRDRRIADLEARLEALERTARD